LGINSPSKVFEEIGKYSIEGFADGLNKFSGVVGGEAKNVGKTAISALSGAVSNISDLISGDMNLNPTIRPVLDLSNVNNGLNSIFGQSQTINLEQTRSKIASMSNVGSNRRADASQNGSSTTTSKNAPEMRNGDILPIMIDKFINNRTQDVQGLVEEIEFYRRQIATGRGM
jgi:hypothetical protein